MKMGGISDMRISSSPCTVSLSPCVYVYVYVYLIAKKEGGISVILRGYLCYFRGVSLLLPFLRALYFKGRSYVLRLNTLNTVKGYRPPLY